MFSQHTLFPLTSLGALSMTGQEGSQIPAMFLNAQSWLLKEKTATGHGVQEIKVRLSSMGSTPLH